MRPMSYDYPVLLSVISCCCQSPSMRNCPCFVKSVACMRSSRFVCGRPTRVDPTGVVKQWQPKLISGGITPHVSSKKKWQPRLISVWMEFWLRCQPEQDKMMLWLWTRLVEQALWILTSCSHLKKKRGNRVPHFVKFSSSGGARIKMPTLIDHGKRGRGQ